MAEPSPPNAPRPWSLWLLLPLAVLGLPILGIALVEGPPHPISSTGSEGGLILFPVVAGALILYGWTRAHAGRSQKVFLAVAVTVTLLWWPTMCIGMLAP